MEAILKKLFDLDCAIFSSGSATCGMVLQRWENHASSPEWFSVMKDFCHLYFSLVKTVLLYTYPSVDSCHSSCLSFLHSLKFRVLG